jgi:thioredoxin-like negative regulator of GroEL
MPPILLQLRKLRKLRTLLAAALLLSAAPLVFPQAAAPNDYSSNPKFQDAMKEGKLLLQQRRPGFAKDAFNKASKIAGGACWECLDGLYKAQIGDQDFKGAIETAGRLEALANRPALKSVAEFDRGNAILAKAGKKPKPDELEQAHNAFQQALTNYPHNLGAMFRDGETLAQMGRIDDARTCFTQCASLAKPTDPARLRAQHFAEDPTLATKPMAPAFEVTALDGSRFNLDAMGGRVVLIDFWATWCGPCNEELPHMKKIAKEFAGEPLVILSVSWDSDDAKWRQFVAKNEMTWIQYRDADHSLTDQFGIHAIPHYFTIDSDGVLTSEMMGEGSDVEGRLKKLLVKAHEAQKLRAEATAATPSGQ